MFCFRLTFGTLDDNWCIEPVAREPCQVNFIEET